jgi:hypothetical protein
VVSTVRAQTKSFALLVGLLGTVGCEVGEDGVAQPNLVIVDDDTASHLVIEPDRVAIPADLADALIGVQPGDVIVSSGDTPILRTVLATRFDAGELVLDTETAAITDALLEGRVQSKRDLFAEPPGSDPDAEADPAGLTISVDRLSLDFSGAMIVDEPDFKVRIDQGSVSFRPSVDIDLGVKWGKVEHFHAIVQGELAGALNVRVAANKKLDRSFSKTLWRSPPYRATQMVGPVPVVEVVRVSLVVSGDAHASGAGNFDLGTSRAGAILRAGASYDKGKWQPIATGDLAFDKRAPTLQGATRAGVALRLSVKVEVRFYDVAGPHLTLGAYGRTELQATAGTTPVWAARVGTDAYFGGSVEVLGKKLAKFERQLFDRGRTFGSP